MMVKEGEYKKIIILGLIIRLGLIFFLSTYERIYDHQLYLTDIDYKVYSDSTLYDSPYDRQTYRYTPIISYLMRFNYSIHQSIGKVFFSLFDVVAMIFLYAIFKRKSSFTLEKDIEKNAVLAVKLYAYNPLFIILTVRGSCEGVTLALTYTFWYYYFGGNTTGNHSCRQILGNKIEQIQPDSKSKWISYMIYGFWVHMRVYPIIFLPLLIFHQYEVKNKNWKATLKVFIQLGIGAGGIFISIAAIFYYIYGQKFIEETFLYHLTRLDNRHTFSPYFYEIYLNYSAEMGGFSRASIRLIPTFYIIVTSLRFLKGYSIFFLHFLATYAFVSFNKVITLQYYMWILGALILVLPESLIFIQKRYRMGFGLLLQYILSIIIWIWLSLSLENEGQNHLHTMWLVCLFQVFMHIWVLTSFIKTIRYYSLEEEKKLKLQAAKRILSNKKD